MKCIQILLTACLCVLLAGCSQSLPAEAESTVASTAAWTVPPVETTHVETEPISLPDTPEATEPGSRELYYDHLTDADFIPIREFIPDISVELKYATADNFTGEVIYDFQEAYLRLGTAKKLEKVQHELRGLGLRLKVWDGFRPVCAQWKLWEAKPDPTFVSHPETGNRAHCRGNAVDVTLIDREGQEVEMPTGFDDFSAKADRDYSDCTDEAAVNAGILQHIMEKHGFTSIQSEWWHFVDETEYPVDADFIPVAFAQWYPVCDAYINLREKPDVNTASIARIPKDASFQVLGWYGRFALAEYQRQRGYVNRDYIIPAS